MELSRPSLDFRSYLEVCTAVLVPLTVPDSGLSLHDLGDLHVLLLLPDRRGQRGPDDVSSCCLFSVPDDVFTRQQVARGVARVLCRLHAQPGPNLPETIPLLVPPRSVQGVHPWNQSGRVHRFLHRRRTQQVRGSSKRVWCARAGVGAERPASLVYSIQTIMFLSCVCESDPAAWRKR
jgi:hypothetical protein